MWSNMDIFTETHFVDNDDIDMFSHLRTSSLFNIMQRAVSKHHLIQGVGHSATIDRGFLWIIKSQHAVFSRVPSYGETITIETWCGNQEHVLYPRYFRIIDENNREIITSSSVWTIMNASTRKLAYPAEHGIYIDGITTGNEISLPKVPLLRETAPVRDFFVPFSYMDLNGHMNNTKYFDVAEDSIAAPMMGLSLSELTIEYRSECRLGEKLSIFSSHRDNEYLVVGKADREVFRIALKYKD